MPSRFGGSVNGNVSGNDGTDAIAISGGTISGDVDAEAVTLTGGNIGGNIVGITGNALVINDPASASPLNLPDGVLFSGTNAVANITDTDLAAGGSRTQVFSGFTSVTASNSTLAFSAAVIDIGSLTLTNGSTLFVNGNVDPTFVSVVGSTITMIDGAADDIFTLGGLALNNATLGFDINQQTLQADRHRDGHAHRHRRQRHQRQPDRNARVQRSDQFPDHCDGRPGHRHFRRHRRPGHRRVRSSPTRCSPGRAAGCSSVPFRQLSGLPQPRRTRWPSAPLTQ